MCAHRGARAAAADFAQRRLAGDRQAAQHSRSGALTLTCWDPMSRTCTMLQNGVAGWFPFFEKMDFLDKKLLVVDVGPCITYDAVHRSI